MALIKELDYGTPIRVADKLVTLSIDGEAVSVPAGTSVMAAAMTMGTAIPKLCATDSLEAVRFLPHVPGGDRRPPRHPRVLHHAGGAGHGGHHPIPQAGRSAPRRDGAIHLRPSA